MENQDKFNEIAYKKGTKSSRRHQNVLLHGFGIFSSGLFHC